MLIIPSKSLICTLLSRAAIVNVIIAVTIVILDPLLQKASNKTMYGCWPGSSDDDTIAGRVMERSNASVVAFVPRLWKWWILTVMNRANARVVI